MAMKPTRYEQECFLWAIGIGGVEEWSDDEIRETFERAIAIKDPLMRKLWDLPPLDETQH